VKEGIPHVHPPAEVLAGILAVRLHVDDCGPDNGPLRVIPGSHRHGKLTNAEIRRLRAETEPLICTVPAGGALLMKPLLLHASSPAVAPAHRRVLHLEFAREPLPEYLTWGRA
jgi:ectoine hydroxylase-related dioxygenase (phytanoyl-CoA dioxygenase family)